MKDGFLSLFYPQGPQLWLAAIAGINAAFRPRAAPRPPPVLGYQSLLSIASAGLGPLHWEPSSSPLATRKTIVP